MRWDKPYSVSGKMIERGFRINVLSDERQGDMMAERRKERTVKKYTKEQRDYMRYPKRMKNGNWFYIGRGHCSFHNRKHAGEGVYVQTRMLVRALKLAGVIT